MPWTSLLLIKDSFQQLKNKWVFSELGIPSPFHHLSIFTWLDVLVKKASFFGEDGGEIELEKKVQEGRCEF